MYLRDIVCKLKTLDKLYIIIIIALCLYFKII